MAKKNQNFQIYKGEAKTLAITVLDEDGVAVDLRTATLLYRVSANAKSTVYLINVDQSQMTITGVGHNVANILFIHDTTDEQKAGTYYHELRVTDSGAVQLVVMTGTFKLDDSNTNIVTP